MACPLQLVGTRSSWEEIALGWALPNGRLPSSQQFCRGFECSLILQDWQDFGRDYDTTLIAGWTNFDSTWPRLSQDIALSFYRLWSYYFLSCAGLFRSGQDNFGNLC